MNATPDHLDDEILSALLDDHAAVDRAAADGAAHLRGCGRCAGRQAELAAARAALADAPVERLDELTRRRLVAGALQAAGEGGPVPAGAEGPARRAGARWASRHPGVIGSAAAVLLALLVGVPFVVGDDGGPGDDATLSAQAPPAVQELAGPFLGDLGDLSDHDALRLRLSGAGAGLAYSAPPEPGASPAAGGSSPAPVPSAAPMGGGLAGSPSARTAAPEGATADGGGSGAERPVSAQPLQGSRNTATDAFAASDQAAGRDRADTDSCVAALLNGPARGGRLIASGTGTFEGRPAIVAAFELSGGTVAFVVDRSGCAVLDQFSL